MYALSPLSPDPKPGWSRSGQVMFTPLARIFHDGRGGCWGLGVIPAPSDFVFLGVLTWPVVAGWASGSMSPMGRAGGWSGWPVGFQAMRLSGCRRLLFSPAVPARSVVTHHRTEA